MDKEKQVEAITKLRDDYDHSFINKEGVYTFTKPFGFEGTTYVAHNTWEKDPKGLRLEEGVEELEGQDAAVVAEEIARKVCGFEPYQMGRGSRLRTACNVVLEHLKKE